MPDWTTTWTIPADLAATHAPLIADALFEPLSAALIEDVVAAGINRRLRDGFEMVNDFTTVPNVLVSVGSDYTITLTIREADVASYRSALSRAIGETATAEKLKGLVRHDLHELVFTGRRLRHDENDEIDNSVFE